MRFYGRFLALPIKSQMQYKLSFFLTLLGQFITSFTSFFAVHFMFTRFNAVEGFTYGQTLLCFAVVTMAFAMGQLLGGGFAVFPRMLGNGAFDRALVWPRSVFLQVLIPNIDFTRLGLLLQAVVVLVIAIPQSSVIWTWDRIITLCLMILCGSVVFFALFLVFAACAFFTVEGLEFFNFFTYGGHQFGRYPFSVYGKGVLMFLTFVIPMALFQYYPLLYLIEKERSALYMLLPLLDVLFLIPSYAFFRFGLRRYKSTGS